MGLVYPINKPLTQCVPHPIPTHLSRSISPRFTPLIVMSVIPRPHNLQLGNPWIGAMEKKSMENRETGFGYEIWFIYSYLICMHCIYKVLNPQPIAHVHVI